MNFHEEEQVKKKMFLFPWKIEFHLFIWIILFIQITIEFNIIESLLFEGWTQTFSMKSDSFIIRLLILCTWVTLTRSIRVFAWLSFSKINQHFPYLLFSIHQVSSDYMRTRIDLLTSLVNIKMNKMKNEVTRSITISLLSSSSSSEPLR